MFARRVDGDVVNEGVPSRGEKVPIVNQGNKVPLVHVDMKNEDVRGAIPTLNISMTAQANRDMGHRVNALESYVASKLKDFVRMNPLIFFWL